MGHRQARTEGSIVTARQEAVDLPAVARFLFDQGVEVSGDLQATLIAGGKSNLTFQICDDVHRWVLRRPPLSGLTPSAHDVAREYRITSALQGSGIPVAPTVALGTDESVIGAPFTIVEYVDGRVFRRQADLDSLTQQQLRTCTDSLVKVLTDLHQVDYAEVGLSTLGRPDGYVARQVKLWARQWELVQSQPMTDLDRLHAWLTDNIPSSSAAAIVHGDYRIDNTIVDHTDIGQILAVVDWELSTLGDPLTDVALMCAYRHSALDAIQGIPAAWTSPDLPSADELAHAYATSSGRDLPHWNFYLGFAYFKIAVIAAGIDHRWRVGATMGEGFDLAGEAVPELIAEGLRQANRAAA